jgi:hypothetical protein
MEQNHRKNQHHDQNTREKARGYGNHTNTHDQFQQAVLLGIGECLPLYALYTYLLAHGKSPSDTGVCDPYEFAIQISLWYRRLNFKYIANFS